VQPDPVHLRARLANATLLLVFTPELCGTHEPLEVIEAVADTVDIIQVRPKPVGAHAHARVSSARASHEWCLRVLDHLATRPALDVLVTVNDRVDVALDLWPQGLAGVHLGQDDCPALAARAFLGDGPLIGYSTHDMRQVMAACDLPVDSLGFGPIYSTPTKGYTRGLGPEAAWIAKEAATLPLFAIGGIEGTNVGELHEVGRVACAASVLSADDPGASARELRELMAR
jgi:thiamine-phosphate pyrophosphorylase